MKNFYRIAGIAFVIGCIFFLKYNFRELEVFKNGYIVNATVVFVPDGYKIKKHSNIKFNYNGKIHVKGIGFLKSKELREGDIIRLKTNINNDVFLYEQENPYINTFSFIMLFLFGIYLIYNGFKR